MKNASSPKASIARPSDARQFVLGRDRFERISAVEGIYLTTAMRSILDQFERDGLSAADRRAAIMRRFAPTT
jgi:hypothetical protein